MNRWRTSHKKQLIGYDSNNSDNLGKEAAKYLSLYKHLEYKARPLPILHYFLFHFLS